MMFFWDFAVLASTARMGWAHEREHDPYMNKYIIHVEGEGLNTWRLPRLQGISEKGHDDISIDKARRQLVLNVTPKAVYQGT